jgi:hypothetical protein
MLFKQGNVGFHILPRQSEGRLHILPRQGGVGFDNQFKSLQSHDVVVVQNALARILHAPVAALTSKKLKRQSQRCKEVKLLRLTSCCKGETEEIKCPKFSARVDCRRVVDQCNNTTRKKFRNHCARNKKLQSKQREMRRKLKQQAWTVPIDETCSIPTDQSNAGGKRICQPPK